MSWGNWFPEFILSIMVSSSRVEMPNSFFDISTMKMKPLRRFETPGTIYPVTQRHMSEKRRPQLHLSESLKTCMSQLLLNISFVKLSFHLPVNPGGRDSVVCIETRYGLDSPSFEPCWGRDFLAPGPTEPPVQWVQGLLLGCGANHPPPFSAGVEHG